MDVNINDCVEVFLTEYGKEIINSDGSFHQIIPKENGLYQFHLWEFMQIFGRYLKVGCTMPFDGNFKIKSIL